ncbi:protein kinase [Actinoallomurus sp. WRP9H-5]|nr:protein kinase [Actinoallomurus rhizosphaericola]
MGTVWRAHDDLLARDVAVKEVLFPPGLTDDEHKVLYERTLREARSAARLNHPGIVTVHDVVEEDGRPCIVMEFVRARSLQEVIDEEGRLPPAQVAEIGAQVLAALRTAHAAGITHRDVKPANVLLAGDSDEPISRSTRVVITDFGIATMEGDSTLTQTGLIMGSPAYVAPERARGDKASPASDLWSLGATLYAAVEGQSPHYRPEAMAALTSVISEEAPPPRHAGALAPVLMGLLDKDPARRLTADQAAEGLTRAAQSTRLLPTPASPNGEGSATGDRTAADDGATGDEPGDGHDRPAPPWRLTADPPPPHHPSVAMAEPGAGGWPYGPATVRDPAPSGSGRPEPSGPAPSMPGPAAGPPSGPAPSMPGPAGGSPPGPAGGPAGPTRSVSGAQDEAWMRTSGQPAQATTAPVTGARRGRAVAIALIPVLVAAGIAVAAVIHNSGGGGRPAPYDAATKQSTPTPRPSPTRSPAPTVPAGYHKVTAQDGATLVVPKGWEHQTNGPQSELWIDQATGNRVEVDTIPWGTSDPVQHWVKWGHDAPQHLPGFQWVSSPTSVTERGWKAGDAEYSWNAGSHGKLYAIDRGFTVNRTQYAIMAAAGSRSAAGTYFGAAFKFFRPAPR